MIVLLVVLMMAISYAIAFKDDFPYILVKRTLIFLGVLLLLKNIRVIIKYILGTLSDI